MTTPVSEIIFSGFVSKAVNNCVDVTWNKIKYVLKNKKNEHQNIESQIYSIIIDVLNEITYNKYKNNQDKIFQAAEILLNSLKKKTNDYLESIEFCMKYLISNVNKDECLKFKALLYEELSKDEYSELFRTILLLQLEDKNLYEQAVYEQLDQKLDDVIRKLNKSDDCNKSYGKRIKSRTKEYAGKWNENMFLNNFNKRDEKAGVNIKLSDIYLKEHLPRYIWEDNTEPLDDLGDFLYECITEEHLSRMLLILGQPGIGKSTLITWIIANFMYKSDDILVYQFAMDLKNIEWENRTRSYNITEKILKELDLHIDDLEGKILIIDGFDEIDISYGREDILNKLYKELIRKKVFENFLLIVTCRENYIQNISSLECEYIVLQPWRESQICSFCTTYQKITGNGISDNTLNKILDNKEIMGIPLILYMILALNISIEQNGSIVDIYDQVFALKGGIYDRCINNDSYEKPHRISESDIKSQIHQISREIAVWMFENNAENAFIPEENYQDICISVIQENELKCENVEQDFLIGNYFKLVKHCEGIETKELYFVHRSIYEYFVAETIYNSIEDSMIELTDKSQESMAGNIAFYLREGKISPTIGEYLQYKIVKFYNKLDMGRKQIFYQWWEDTVDKMMDVGMFYYTERNIRDFKGIMEKERRCFLNLLEILRLLLVTTNRKYIMESVNKYNLCDYIGFGQGNKYDKLFLKETDLRGIYLHECTLENANLCGADLQRADLVGTNFYRANLQDADLRGANLRSTRFKRTNLIGTKFDEKQIDEIKDCVSNLQGIKIYMGREECPISYKDYCRRKKRK